MENPKDETPMDESAPPAEDVDEQDEGSTAEKPVEPPEGLPKDPPKDPEAPKKRKGPGAEEEDSYEDGWYQVLKRRAVGAGDQEE